jgi:hypothetical protein
MRIGNSIAIGVSYCLLAAALAAHAAETLTGRWMIDTVPGADPVQLTLHRGDGRWTSTSSFSIAPSSLRGLTRTQIDSAAGQTVRFEIARDAGTLNCEGYFKAGNGAGAFSFAANPSFISEMRSLGYDGLSTETVYSMAMHDLGPKYVRELKALGLNRLSIDDLTSMRIHGVTPEYIRALRDLGYSSLDADQLVSMRIHGVEVEFVRDLKNMGYHPTTDELVSLRIHGATTDFVKQIKDLGYGPTLDQLVTMRIHGVTPEYIHDMRARGLKNLSIDQLVNLKIHGISD